MGAVNPLTFFRRKIAAGYGLIIRVIRVEV